MRKVGLVKPSPLQKELYNAPTEFAAGNRKFAVGKNPLELERELDVIQPQNPQQQKRMVEIMEQLYKDAGNDPARKNALEMWRMQLQSADAESLVKTDFQKRFYFWLLGRGTAEDTKKTFWGRGNMAAHNPEVAAYIDQFLESRANYAMQLALLANRAPTTLLGAYLYFKYIVNGNLKQTTENGKTWWHLDQSDYLEDFDLFRKYFDRVPDDGNREATPDDKYSKLVQPQEFRPADAPANAGQEPYPVTSEQKAQWALDADGDIDNEITMVAGQTNVPDEQPVVNKRNPKRRGGGIGVNAPPTAVPPAGNPNLPANVGAIDSAAVAQQVAAAMAERDAAAQRDKAARKQVKKAAKQQAEQQRAEERRQKREAEKQRHEAMMGALNKAPPPPPAAAPVVVNAPPVRDEAWLDERRRELEAFHATGREQMQTWMTNTLAAQREEMEKRDRLLAAELAKFGQGGRDDAKLATQLAAQHTATLDALNQLGANLRSYRPEPEIVRDIPNNAAELDAVRKEAQARSEALERDLIDKFAHAAKAFEARQQELEAALAAERQRTEQTGDQSLNIARAAKEEIARLQAEAEAREAALAERVNAANEARERQHADELAAYQAREQEAARKLENATRMAAEDTAAVRRELDAKMKATAAQLQAEAKAQTDAEKQRLAREAADAEARRRQERTADHMAMQKLVNEQLSAGQRDFAEARAYIQNLKAESQKMRAMLDDSERSRELTGAEVNKLRKAIHENEGRANQIALKVERPLLQPPASVAGDKGKEKASEPVQPPVKIVSQLGVFDNTSDEQLRARTSEAAPKFTPVKVAVKPQPSRVLTRSQTRARQAEPVAPSVKYTTVKPPAFKYTNIPGPAARVLNVMNSTEAAKAPAAMEPVPVPKPVVESPPMPPATSAPATPASEKDVAEAAKHEQQAEQETAQARKAARKHVASRNAKALQRLRGNPKRAIADVASEISREMAADEQLPKEEVVASDWEKLDELRRAFEAAGAKMPALEYGTSFERNYEAQIDAMGKAGETVVKKVNMRKRGKTERARVDVRELAAKAAELPAEELATARRRLRKRA